jgi:hypothetical protein
MEDREVGVQVPAGSQILSPPRRPDRFWGPTQPPIRWVPEVKWPGRGADHSPQTSAEVKKTLIYTFTHPYVFVA